LMWFLRSENRFGSSGRKTAYWPASISCTSLRESISFLSCLLWDRRSVPESGPRQPAASRRAHIPQWTVRSAVIIIRPPRIHNIP